MIDKNIWNRAKYIKVRGKFLEGNGFTQITKNQRMALKLLGSEYILVIPHILFLQCLYQLRQFSIVEIATDGFDKEANTANVIFVKKTILASTLY